jgi:methionine aminopeptidase
LHLVAIKPFGTKALLALRELESIGDVHQFDQLVEDTKKPVAQSEHTIFIDKTGKVVTTQ